MTTNHTPGPWTINGGDIEAGAVRLAVVDRPEDDAGNRNAGIDWDEAYANARLIACAPELLAALEAVVNMHCRPTTPLTYVDHADAMPQARAAIAKAKS